MATKTNKKVTAPVVDTTPQEAPLFGMSLGAHNTPDAWNNAQDLALPKPSQAYSIASNAMKNDRDAIQADIGTSKADAISQLDSKIADIKWEINKTHKEIDAIPDAPLDENDKDQLEENKLRAGADAYMAYDPDSAMLWQQKADALKDKREARLFAIKMQNDPNSPQNIQKISTALNSVNYVISSPGFQAMDKAQQQPWFDRAANLQKQLSNTTLGSAYSGLGDNVSASNKDLSESDNAKYNSLAPQIKTMLKFNDVGLPVNEADVTNFLNQNQIDMMNTNAPIVKALNTYMDKLKSDAQTPYKAQVEKTEQGIKVKTAADEDYNRWLATYNEEVKKAKGAVSAVAQLAKQSSDPDNAALNMAIVDSFVKSAVGGKVTQYAAGNIGTMAESWLQTIGHKFGFSGQSYSEKTIMDAGGVSADEGLQALKTLQATDPKFYDRFYKESIQAPLEGISTELASKFTKKESKKTTGSATTAPDRSKYANTSDYLAALRAYKAGK